MPFYHYSQNNSGGRFSVQEAEGITHHVIIEASDAAHANRRAESIGLYFDGCENDQDCSCCGDRWSRAYDPGDTVPLLYGSPPESHSPDMRFLDDDQPEWIIHYLDGSIKKENVSKAIIIAAAEGKSRKRRRR